MQEHDQHVSPIKSPRQLVIVVALAFIVPIALIVLLSQLVTGGPHGRNESDPRVLSRIQAFGNVVMADASGPKGNLSGEAVYGQVCKTCHEAGLAGAPKTGDKAAWTARLAQGQATLVKNAIAGFQGKAGVMPPKGGNADLTDAEVERAVVHMANLAGASWKEPVAVAAAPAATAARQRRRQRHPRPLLQRRSPSLLARHLPQPPMARRSTKARASPATVPASRVRPSSATRPRGRRASRRV